jgi:hypothetical protein
MKIEVKGERGELLFGYDTLHNSICTLPARRDLPGALAAVAEAKFFLQAEAGRHDDVQKVLARSVLFA